MKIQLLDFFFLNNLISNIILIKTNYDLFRIEWISNYLIYAYSICLNKLF